MLPLLLLGVFLRVNEATDVDPKLVQDLVREVSSAIEARTGVRPVLEPGQGETLALRVLGGLRRAVVIAERIDGDKITRRELSFALSSPELGELARTLARELFPEAPATVVLPTPAPPPRSSKLLPWILAGGGALAGGAAIVMAVRASSLDTELHGAFGPSYLERDRARAQLSAAAVVSLAIALGALGACALSALD